MAVQASPSQPEASLSTTVDGNWWLSNVPASWRLLMSSVVSVSATSCRTVPCFGAEGDKVDAGGIVANWDPHTHPIVTEVRVP